MKTARNVAIIVAIAAAATFLPGVGNAGGTLSWLLTVILYGTLGWYASVVYRENRARVYGLADQGRVIVYGSLALAAVALVGTNRLWNTGGGTLLWFAMVGGAAIAVFDVVRRSREY